MRAVGPSRSGRGGGEGGRTRRSQLRYSASAKPAALSTTARPHPTSPKGRGASPEGFRALKINGVGPNPASGRRQDLQLAIGTSVAAPLAGALAQFNSDADSTAAVQSLVHAL